MCKQAQCAEVHAPWAGVRPFLSPRSAGRPLWSPHAQVVALVFSQTLDTPDRSTVPLRQKDNAAWDSVPYCRLQCALLYANGLRAVSEEATADE